MKIKQFYVVYVGNFDSLPIAENKSPRELTNKEFKAIAEEPGHVYTIKELCAEWKTDTLPVIDYYLRFS